MVGGEHRHPLPPEVERFDVGQELTDRPVDLGDLRVVAVRWKVVTLRRQAQRFEVVLLQPVGRVRLDVVDPEKERPIVARVDVVLEPLDGRVVDVVGRRLAAHQSEPALSLEHGPVFLEVLAEVRGLVLQRPVGDDRGGPVALGTQHLGKRFEARSHAKAVTRCAVLVRVARRDHRAQRRGGERLDGAGLREADPVRHEAIEVRRRRPFVAVAGHPVGA